jgi:PHD/YefM family antitoxin component YafN of YafNO toxin-antitoxin module
MPTPAVRLNPQYVTDRRGQRRAVILPISEYEQLLEELEDLAIVAERRDEPAVSHAKVVMELKRDGYLPR